MSKLTINPDKLTIGDLEDFEDVTGQTIDEALKPHPVYELDEDGKPRIDPLTGGKVRAIDPETKRPATEVKTSTKVLKALVWIAYRADSKDFTIEDARNVRISELVIDNTGEDANPKDDSDV